MKIRLSPDFNKPGFFYRFEILLPIIDNERNLINPKHIKALAQKLMETFGGVTINLPYGGGGGVDGMFQSSVSNLFYKDNSAVFMVLTNEDPEAISFFQKNIPKWENKFKQEKILALFHRVQSF